MSEFIFNFGKWIAILGPMMILGVYLYRRNSAGLRKRQRRFEDRPVLSEDAWFTELYPLTSKRDRALALEFLGVITHGIDIDWRRFRPEDTIENVLGTDPKCDLALDAVETVMRIENLLIERGITAPFQQGFSATLSEFLDEWIAINRPDKPNG